jgi:OmpA-OmpF porin, OOP family
MDGDRFYATLGVALAVSLWPVTAVAQAEPASDLLAQDVSSLRGEIGNRYDAALALTQDNGIVAGDSNQYMWASQAKAQCGIALGFLKSSTKDPVSIGKCVDAHARMQLRPAPPPRARRPAPRPVASCNKVPFIVFFDFDRSDLTAEGIEILSSTAKMLRDCGNPAVSIDGYTDRSGSDQYNLGLSQRRANAVRDYLASQGFEPAGIATQAFGEGNPRVPTADGVREL